MIETTLGDLIQKKEAILAEEKQYLEQLPIEQPKTPTKESKDEKQQVETKVSNEKIELLEKENEDLRKALELSKAEVQKAISEKEDIKANLDIC